MMSETESVLVDSGAVVASPRPPVGSGDKGAAVGTVLWGRLLNKTGVPPEIVRECEKEWRGVVVDPRLNVEVGGGDDG
jgi:hypothetical protein